MSDFSRRLKSEIEYSGLLYKELAYKAGIKKRALDMYVGSQCSMPPADVAVKLAAVLGVTVEYLVTGREGIATNLDPLARKYRNTLADMELLPEEVLNPLLAAIHFAAEAEKQKKREQVAGD